MAPQLKKYFELYNHTITLIHYSLILGKEQEHLLQRSLSKRVVLNVELLLV